MIARVMTVALKGFDGALVEVEADLKQGLPAMHIVGMGNKAVEEARERVRSAITNSLLDFPTRKLIVTLHRPNCQKTALSTTFRLPSRC
jgi:magnesium chelatase family protein